MAAEVKKYFWLRLHRDFFKRHDVRVIESMPNGEKYVLFYLKLLTESIDHHGELRFSETIPYDERMLSAVTNTDIDIVRSATKLFIELNLMEILDNDTIFMNEVQKMIGSETDWARKKRIYRANKDNPKLIEDNTRTKKDNVRQEIEIEKEIEKELKEKNTKKKTSSFKKPTIEEILKYCKERKNNIDPSAFYDFYESVGWKVGNKPMKDWKAAVRTWERRNSNFSSKGSNNHKPKDIEVDWLEDYIKNMDQEENNA